MSRRHWNPPWGFQPRFRREADKGCIIPLSFTSWHDDHPPRRVEPFRWVPPHAAHPPLLRPKIDKIVVFRISKFAQKTDRPKITFFRICWWFSGSPTLIGSHFGSKNRSRKPLLRDFWRQNRIFHSGSSFRCFFATRRQKISDARKTSFLENHRFP